MKDVYCAVRGNQIVGIHKKKKVVKSFIEQHQEENLRIGKLNVKSEKYEDFLLVKLGDKYIPEYLYETAKSISDEWKSDIEYAIKILQREKTNLGKEEKKVFKKTIGILKSIIESDGLEDLTLFSLEEETENRAYLKDIMCYDNNDYGYAKY